MLAEAASIGRQCAAASLLGALGLLAGCDQTDHSRITTAAGDGGTPKDAPLSPSPPPDLAFPWADRELDLDPTRGLITIRGNGLSARDTLEWLADELGFRLVIDADLSDVDVAVEDIPLSGALSALVPGHDFILMFGVDPDTRRHAPEAVLVGEPAQSEEIESPVASPRSELTAAADDRYGGFAGTAGTVPEAWMARHQSAVSALLDSDPRVRLDAVTDLEPNLGFGYPILRAVVLTDPDPKVRLAAVRLLGRADGYLARRTLLDDLQDPVPEVVLEILDLIEGWEDPGMVQQLRNLAYHPNEDVRQRSAEVIAALK